VYLGAVAGIVLLMHAGAHTGGLLTTALYVTFDAVIVTGLFGVASYLLAPRILTSIEGEPLLIEDLIGRRDELNHELTQLQQQSEGWLREEIDEKIIKDFRTVSFLMRQMIKREPLTKVLAEAREPFKDRLTRMATAEERTLLLDALETMVTLRRVEALIFLHQAMRIWIAPHVISTSLMLALMIVHVIQVVYFAVK
jgi:hypothetical protein